MTELREHTTERDEALRIGELVLDVRADCHAYVTVEAGTRKVAGVNLVRHGTRGEDAESVLTALIEAVQKLGIRAESYRIVREDLPPQPVVEHRYPAGSGLIRAR